MAAITVRSVAPRDRAAWERLWSGYNAFYGRAEPTALPEAVSASTWRRFFDPGEPVHALVAELDGQVVGLLYATLAERSGFIVFRHTPSAPRRGVNR